MVIDHIIKFLQYDVGQLFNNDNCCLCCLKFSLPHGSKKRKCLKNIYPPRPNITEGCEDDEEDGDEDEDEECEDRNAKDRGKCQEEDDDDCEVVEMKGEEKKSKDVDDECECEDDDKDEGKDECSNAKKKSSSHTSCKRKKLSTCQTVCQRLISMIVSRCSRASKGELDTIEDRARKLWRTLAANAGCSDNKYPQWWDLKSWQKLPFYWAALSNEILCEDPAENFKRFYNSFTEKTTKRTVKKQNESALILWHSLNSKQRLPFVVEAFISKVAAGKVDINDEHEIQRVIGELLRF